MKKAVANTALSATATVFHRNILVFNKKKCSFEKPAVTWRHRLSVGTLGAAEESIKTGDIRIKR